MGGQCHKWWPKADFFKKCKSFLKRFIFISKTEFAVREELEKVFHLLVHSPNGCNGQSWTVLEPGIRSFFQVYHMDAGSQGLGPSSTIFQDSEQDRKWSSWDSSLYPYGMPEP